MKSQILAFFVGAMTWCWYTAAAEPLNDPLLKQGEAVLAQLQGASNQIQAGRTLISTTLQGSIVDGKKRLGEIQRQIVGVKGTVGGINDLINQIPSDLGIKAMAFELVQLRDTPEIIETVNNKIVPEASKLLTDIQAKLETLTTKINNSGVDAKFNNALTKLGTATTKLSKTLTAYKKSLLESEE